MPTTWLEWKCKASLLDNQWRQFRDTQPKATINQMFLFHPPPAVISTTPTASSVPQPMDLDHTHPMKRNPHHGLCFNCGKPGHITKVCQGPCTQNVENVDAMTIPRLAPEDLQFLTESLRVMVTPSVPMMPLAESEGEPWQYSCLLSIDGQCPSWHFSGPKEISRCPHLAPFLMHHTALQDHHAVFSSHHCPCHQHLRSSSYTLDPQLT